MFCPKCLEDAQYGKTADYQLTSKDGAIMRVKMTEKESKDLYHAIKKQAREDGLNVKKSKQPKKK